MATGPYAAISSYDNSGTQALAVTDKINDTGDLMSVFWNKNDTFKQIIHGYSTVQVPSSVSTKDASWGKTQTFEISKDADALGNIYLSIVVDLDIPETPLNYGPPQTLTTLLRRPSSKESITLHPMGLPHGPQPGKYEDSIGKKKTEELAVMIDTFNPLYVAKEASSLEDEKYQLSWLK